MPLIPRRKKYVFSHPKATGPMTILAFTEKSARKKMRQFVIHMMYGDWALMYDEKPVDAIMRDMTMSKEG